MSDSGNQVAQDTEIFCRMVRGRSAENDKAMLMLHMHRLFGQCMGVLRQEVDSMIRAIYLLNVPDARRADLLAASASGSMWKRDGGKGRLTDREMVELADGLEGWTGSVYKFGCGFIHLSRYHDYSDTDPLSLISDDDRTSVLKHMRAYHHGPAGDHPSFEELAHYFPRVFTKIRGNLECYLEELEKRAGLRVE